MHPNEKLLRDADEAQTRGDFVAFMNAYTDDVVVHMPGKSSISGDYKGKDQFFSDFFGTLMSLTGGQIAVKPHDILGNADHAIGVYTWTATRGDRRLEWRQVNVYHVRDGQLVEIWQHPFDFQRWNEFWS